MKKFAVLFLVVATVTISVTEGTLPFLELETTAGVDTVRLPAQNDGVSNAINIPLGFILGNTSQTTVYVTTDGYFSFGRPVACCPDLSLSSTVSNYIVAPFGSNTNIASGTGTVSYEVHNMTTSPGLLSKVNKYIQQSEQVRFAGTWMLVVEWNDVPQSGQTNGMTNTFQGIVVTNGYQSFTVFTYRCGSMQWSGDAMIGFKVNNEFVEIHDLSGQNASSVACRNFPITVWSNVVYQLHLREMPFLSVEGNRTTLPTNTEDSASDSIPIPGGLPFGNSIQNTTYVSTNGIISFSRPFTYHSPSLFPGSSFYNFIIAPFWTDNDISRGVGQVSYWVYDNETESESIDFVSTFISQQEQVEFSGTWMLTAEWRDVPEYLGNTAITNTYQASVITDGRMSFAVFTYNCRQMLWSGGAGIGVNADGRFFRNHNFSRAINARDIACLNSPKSNWSNVIYQLYGDYIPFLDLGSTTNINQVPLMSTLDSKSGNITIPSPFPFGGSFFTSLSVSSNGLFSFGRSVNFFSPVRFPNSSSYRYLAAPFWADHDPRPSGQISYEIHDRNTELLSIVSRFIRQQTATNFNGRWLLVTEWNNVAEYGFSADKTNTYQGMVVTDGTDSYALYIYQCGSMSWHGRATVGFNAGGSLFDNHPLSGNSSINSLACVNYTTTMWTSLVYKLTPLIQPYILYTRYSSYIQRVNIAGGDRRTVYTGGYPRALTFDYRRDQIFWTDDNSNRIYRASTNGSNSMIIVNTGLSCPDGLAWDWVNAKLYWTDYCADEIEVYDPETRGRKIIVRTGSNTNPRGIVLDPSTRQMYWTDTGSVPKIERASMDGTSRIAIIGTSLSTPYGLTLDIFSQKLYWMDYSRNRLEMSNVDGTNRVTLTTRMISDPYFLSFYEGNLYWGDWAYNRLLTTSVSTPNNVAYFGSSVGSDVYGIHVIAAENQREAPNPCAEDNGNCTHLCLLSSTNTQGYSCTCPEGLVQEGNTCRVPSYLLFSYYNGYIQRSRVDGTERVTVYRSGQPRAVDFDFRTQSIFWMDVNSDRLYRSFLNGTRVTTLVTSGIQCSEGLAWDWINEKLYWTDYCRDQIEVYDQVTRQRSVIVATGSGSSPYTIIVDPGTGWMYWSDTGLRRIERASMDGGNRRALHTTNLQTPFALTIDYATQTLYWSDYALNKLESSNTDGSNRRLLTTNIRDPYKMTFFDGVLYWSDWSYNGIYSTLTTSPSSITSLLYLGSDPYGIQVIDRSIQFDAPNPCSVDNGNCSYMCLLSADSPSGFNCACPGDDILNEDESRCEAPPRLLFSVYSSLVRRVNTDGRSLTTVYSATYPRALDFDSRRQYVFWVDFSNDRIQRGNGIETPTSYTTLVSTDITCADGLAWDWIGENIYWTDYCQDEIEVYNPQSGHRTVIINTGLTEPHAIVVDPTTRLLYWTDTGMDRIERASMDGSSRVTLHSSGLSTVYGITIDYDNQILYWADYSNNRIEMSMTDGSNRRVLTSSGITDPFGITYYAGKLYWTDWSGNRIYTLSISTPTVVTQVTSSLGQDPYGIHVVSEDRQPDAPNPCLGSNCSHICLLSDSRSEGYTCACPTSFILDSNQRDCRAPLGILYTVYRPYVRRVNLDGSNIRTLYSGGYPYAVDFDFRRSYLFWSDVNNDRIWRANLDGSNPEIMVRTGIPCVGGLAWDWVNQKLYWTDYCDNDIEVYDPVTRGRRVLFRTGLSNPYGIVVDPTNGWMYWTDVGTDRIERATMDGNSRTVLHSSGLSTVYGLTLDYQNQTLYWVDYSYNRVERSSVTGSDRVVVRTGLRDPWGVTYYSGRVYWTDWYYDRIYSTSVTSSSSIVRVTSSSLGGNPYGIHILTEERQPLVTNPCSAANCSSLCLLSAMSPTRSNCSCPDGFVINDNQTECIAPPRLLFTLYSAYIRQVELDGSRIVNIHSGGRPRGIDFDYRRENMFWTDDTYNRIWMAKLNGTRATTLITTGLSCPDGIAWDWINEKLYWADTCNDVIEVYDPATRYRKVLLYTGSNSNNRDVVVDPTTGWLYWTDYYSSVPKIQRVSMDGMSKTILHDADLSAPYGLTLDYDTQTLYWTDYSRNRIEKSNADGSDRTIVTTTLVNDAYSITFYNGRLYWTDLSYNRILTAPVDTGTSTYLTNSINDMYGITVVSDDRQPLVHNPCGDDRGGCSHFCLLSSITAERYKCGCPNGMELLNDTFCGPSPYLLFTRYSNNIQRVYLDGTMYRTVRSSGYTHALDFDYRRGYMFWSDTNYDRIYRARLDGSGSNTLLVSSGLSTTYGIAWDWINEKLYWADASTDRIEVYDPATRYRKVLINTGSNTNPADIIVDPNNGWMYWTDYGTFDRIERASMDGTSRMVLHNTDLSAPYGLTLDYASQTLYWIDNSLDKIESSHADGTNRMLLTRVSVQCPWGITFYDDKLYWSDHCQHAIYTTFVNQPNSVTTLVSTGNDPYRLHVISEERQPITVSNPCDINNGNCSHFCLLSSTNSTGYSCACPDSLDLDSNQRECVAPPYILIADYRYLRQMNLDGSNYRSILNFGYIHSMDFDYRRGYSFWSDRSNDRIIRNFLNNTHSWTTLVSGSMSCVYDIAWDWISEKMYWTDICTREIEVYDPTTTYRRVLFNGSSNVLNPRGIVVDPTTGWFYWTDYGRDTIERASMDGTSRSILHSTNMRETYAIAIDRDNQVLYWADYTLNRIESSNTDGSSRRLLTTSVRDPFSLTYYNDRLYWGDLYYNRILSGPANSPGSGSYLGGRVSYEVYGIEVIARDLQPIVRNPCSNGNGNCSHMCLLSSINPEGYGCACPVGHTLVGDGRSCSMCPPNSFVCHNAECIPSIWECDGVNDCADNTDEINCSGSDASYLPFITLRTTNNVVKKSLPPSDDSISNEIDIPAGFAFDNTTLSSIYVATNGYMSFSQSVTSIQNPSPFNESDALEYIVAPYWSDIDTSTSGSVSYEFHTNKTSLPLLHKVSKYIRQREHNYFSGTWMLVAEWNNVAAPGPNYGDLRLVQRNVVNGTFSSGRLEIYINGQWGTICDDFFDLTDANVACKQLGFSGALSYRTSSSAGYNSGTGQIWLDDLHCTTSDTRLISCRHRPVGTHSCGHSEDIAVFCNDTGYLQVTQNNTFQGVVITNGFQSYAIFTYRCGLMGWSGNATIGYKARGDRVENNVFNGDTARLVACSNSTSNSSWTNVLYSLSQRELPFLMLGATPGVSRTYFPSVADGSSQAIHIPGGFPFGQSNQTIVYVSSEGYFSFGEGEVHNTPQRFSSSSPITYIVAPFWANNDISNRVGNISYEVHTVHNSPRILNLVSSFITQQQQVRFNGSWMLVATWNDVPQSGGSLTNTNSYEGIIITNGQQSYALFTYQCGRMEWSGGATIGFNAAGNFYQNHYFSGANARNIACIKTPVTNLIYQLSETHLPFFELGVTPGMTKNYLSRTVNASSLGITIPGGFAIGTTNQTLAYLTSDGYFSFGRQAHFSDPVLFPGANVHNYLVAPYWVNFDIRQSGNISYEVHTRFTSLMSSVNNYIQQQDDGDFVATWMMVGNFEEAPLYGSLENDTNNFQAIIITNGNKSYALFTYLCSALSSSIDVTNGTIGFNSDGTYFRNYPLSGTQRLPEVACLNHPRTMWSNLLYTLTPTSELTVSLMPNPSGPSYEAATWISFQCQANGGSSVYRYKWKVYCIATDVKVFESEFSSDTSFRIKSTPSTCSNKVECIAEDRALPISGSANVSITSITGVGLFANDNPASNLSTVIAYATNQIGTIYCSSGSQTSGIGRWFAPNGAEITQNSGSSFNVVRGGGNFPSYVGLQLKTGQSFSTSDEGVYTCVIPDETGIQQTLHVGLYSYGYYVIPTARVSSTTDPTFTLKCNTTGAPAAISWTSPDRQTIYTDDATHRLSQSLLDGATANFESSLAFTSLPYQSDNGQRFCIATATYVSANSLETNTSTAIGVARFAMYSAGDSVSINCVDSSGMADQLQWVDPAGSVLTTSSSSSVTLAWSSITDQHHGLDYVCRIRTLGVTQDFNYTLIILIPPIPLTTQINPSSTGPQMAGSQYTLTCIALKTNSGLTSSAQTQWVGPSGTAVVTGGAITLASPVSEPTRTLQMVTFTSLSTAHAGVYSCEGTFASPALTTDYQANTSYTVTVSALPPSVEINVDSSQFLSQRIVTLSCNINLPSAVTDNVAIEASWTGPSGVLRNSSDVRLSNTYRVSEGVFRSTATISGYDTTVNNGDYVCNATVLATSPYVIGTSGVGRRNVIVSQIGLTVQTEPTAIAVLDATPYNNFNILCTASVPSSVVATKSFVWRSGSSGTGTVLTSDTNTRITTSNPSNAISTSMLTVNASSAGTYIYTCDVTVSSSLSSASTTVTVNGPANPSQPTSVRYIDTTHSTATIEWTVPSIAYTPETYYVEYGTSPTTLDQQSSMVGSGRNLTVTNRIYALDVTGLSANRTYYYRVVASNSFSATRSSTGSFVTASRPTTGIDVVVRAQGVARTGEVYRLTCIVTKDSTVMTAPVINWVVSGQLFTASKNGITLRPTVSNDTTSISVLQFDQLTVMHEGDYICQAGLASTTSAYTYNLAVQRQALDVSIISNPPGVIHQASSSLTLTCVVAGQSNAQLSYQWSSTCTDSCFVLGSREQSVMRSSLRSQDSGNHTCMASDSLGNQGMATIQITVVTVAPTSSIFQLRILAIKGSCHDWRLSNAQEKVQTISEQITSRLSQDCQCSITADSIVDAQFFCDSKVTTDVIFRARLSSTSQVSDTDLILILREWVVSGTAFVVVDNAQLHVDANCEVLLLSYTDPICPASGARVTTDTPTTAKDGVGGTAGTNSGTSTSSILWPIVGTVAGGVVIILVVLIAIQICNRRGKAKRQNGHNRHGPPQELSLHHYEASPSINNYGEVKHNPGYDSPLARRAVVPPAILDYDTISGGFENPAFTRMDFDDDVGDLGVSYDKANLIDDSMDEN